MRIVHLLLNNIKIFEMKKVLYILGGIFVLVMMSFMPADFFSSMTKVDYVEGSKTLKFTTKMNAEHISNAIRVQTNAPNFGSEAEKYVGRTFTVSVNGVAKSLTFTGSQVNGETLWVYFEAGGVSDMSSIKIKNTILLDVYPKQFNVVNIAYKGQQKTMNFLKGKETNEVSF